MWGAARLAAFLGDRDDQGLRLNDLLTHRPRHLVRGGLVGETAHHDHHAFLGPRSCQSQRQSTIGWEKFPRSRQSWPSRFIRPRYCQKQRHHHHELGKIPGETAIHGHPALLDPPRAKTSNRLGKTPAGTANHGHFQEQRRSDWSNQKGRPLSPSRATGDILRGPILRIEGVKPF